MKKLLFVLCTMIFTVALNAQSSGAKANQAVDKEAKAKMKQKQAEDLNQALKEIGVDETVAAKFKELQQSYGNKSTEIRKNTSLSEDEKEKQLKANMEEKNMKLVELIGADKYKEYNKIRKSQKEKDGKSGN